MKQLTFFLVFSIFALQATAQNEPCKVLADSLAGTYEGGCKKGNADGEGKAAGAHKYEGHFKNGLPDGKGKYTWANGDVYDGEFKKGLKEGYGELHTRVGKIDSVTTGYWKKDVYKGKYDKPYILHYKSSDVARVEINKTGNSEKTITISVSLLAGGGTLGTTNNRTAMVLTDVQVMRGLFIYKGNQTISNKDITVFRGVDFPFRARYSFGASQVDIEIFEPGEWEITVPIL